MRGDHRSYFLCMVDQVNQQAAHEYGSGLYIPYHIGEKFDRTVRDI